MYERTRFGTTPHSQKVVQDSDVYPSTEDGKIKAPTAVGRMWLVGQRFSAAWLQERLALSFESTATSIIQAPAAHTEPASFHELAR
jgi:hypothetical protein